VLLERLDQAVELENGQTIDLLNKFLVEIAIVFSLRRGLGPGPVAGYRKG
jgi:hypothetical protein